MGYELPSKEEILDFLDKNSLTVKDLKEITGKGDSTVRDWLASLKDENSKPKFPKDTWLLLNALFNRNASFVTDIIREYSKGDAFVKNPELVWEFHDKIKVMKNTTQMFKEMNDMDRKEEVTNRLHKEHLKIIKEEWANKHGLGGKIRIQDRELYIRIREKEKKLDIVTSVAIGELEKLSDEYDPAKKDNRFISRLLNIYDDYIEGIEQLREWEYIEILENATEKNVKPIYGNWDKSPEKRRIVGHYLVDSPELAKEIENMSMATLYDMMHGTDSDLKNTFQIEQNEIYKLQKTIDALRAEKKQLKEEVSGLKEQIDDVPVTLLTPAIREEMNKVNAKN